MYSNKNSGIIVTIKNDTPGGICKYANPNIYIKSAINPNFLGPNTICHIQKNAPIWSILFELEV